MSSASGSEFRLMRTTVSRKLDSQPAVGSGGCGSRAVTCRTSDGNSRVVKDLRRKTGIGPVHHPRTRYVTRSRRRGSGSASSQPRSAGSDRPLPHHNNESSRPTPGWIAVALNRAWRPRRPVSSKNSTTATSRTRSRPGCPGTRACRRDRGIGHTVGVGVQPVAPEPARADTIPTVRKRREHSLRPFSPVGGAVIRTRRRTPPAHDTAPPRPPAAREPGARTARGHGIADP